ncbi:MAG: hypothetical protein M0Q00_04380 [Acholeplasmataceae bacterium]|nr:hypothetical protein [Acholeplasmataceae bacterium]
MSNNVHTLTAYDLSFKYLERNNPLKDELKEKIKNQENPTYDLEAFFLDFANGLKDKNIAKNSGKIITITGIEDIFNKNGNVRYYIRPNAGKRGIPTKIINVDQNNSKEYIFNEKWASTYPHNIFVYSINGNYYAVFHRFSGSGCKTIFQDAANEILKSKGMKMILDWKPSVSKSDNTDEINPKSIKLKFEKEIKSEDIADYVDGKRKKKIFTVRELMLDLRVRDNHKIREILQNLRLKKLTKDSAFKAIQQETSDEYNDASITVKMGSTSKVVKWDDFENLFGGYDITEQLGRLKDSHAFIDALKSCTDDYIYALVEE